MFRRLAALLVMLALMASSVAVCLPGSPAAMACCAKSDPTAPPIVRSCCGPLESSPSTAPASVASVRPAPLQPGSFIAFAGPSRIHTLPSAVRAPRVEIRLLLSVFLI